MKDMIGYGEYLLLHYQEMQGHLRLLAEELETVQAVSADEMLEAMALRRGNGQGRGGRGGVRDNTGAVALVYREAARRLNEANRQELKLELEVGQGELRRLQRVLETLPPLQRQVLEGLYIQGKTGSALSDELAISPRSLYRYRKAGLERLNAMLGGRCCR